MIDGRWAKSLRDGIRKRRQGHEQWSLQGRTEASDGMGLIDEFGEHCSEIWMIRINICGNNDLLMGVIIRDFVE